MWSIFCRKNKLVVLMYHHVGPVTDEKERKYFVSPEMFEQQINFLKINGFHILSLEELEEAYTQNKDIPKKSVLVTLDDGWLDNYQYAYPIALKYNAPITIFLSTDLTGKDTELLTWEQVEEMRKSGVVSFSPHGATHRRLRNLSDQEVMTELQESKKKLEVFLGKDVISFCYPFGAVDRRVRKLTLQAGYKLDFGTRKGINRWPWSGSRPLLRAHVFNDESLNDFSNEVRKGRK